MSVAGLALLLTLCSPMLPVTAHTDTTQAATPSDATPSSNAPSDVIPMQAPLFDDLGSYTFQISTRSERAQRYFDQAMVLAFGFNHAEAYRSFSAAAQIDPTCAMCHWGMAYVLGPNINAAMEAGDVPTAYESIQTAIAPIRSSPETSSPQAMLGLSVFRATVAVALFQLLQHLGQRVGEQRGWRTG